MVSADVMACMGADDRGTEDLKPAAYGRSERGNAA